MKTINVWVNGHAIAAPADASIAAAIAMTATTCFRRSVSAEPRAALCGMGVCFECRVRVDGAGHVRACMTPVHEGMQVQTDD
ncbi:aerobic-type carbon monoxide dehydrogenase small subunit (CoxS/CutS family) [Rhodanobacter sp. TND4EL1]